MLTVALLVFSALSGAVEAGSIAPGAGGVYAHCSVGRASDDGQSSATTYWNCNVPETGPAGVGYTLVGARYVVTNDIRLCTGGPSPYSGCSSWTTGIASADQQWSKSAAGRVSLTKTGTVGTPTARWLNGDMISEIGSMMVVYSSDGTWTGTLRYVQLNQGSMMACAGGYTCYARFSGDALVFNGVPVSATPNPTFSRSIGSSDDLGWPETYFTGGTPPVSFCESLEVESVGPAGQKVLAGGTAQITLTSADYATIPETVDLGTRWSSSYGFIIISNPTGAGPWTITSTNDTGRPVTLSAAFELQCVESGEYLFFDATGTSSDTPSTVRPCSDLAFTWPIFPWVGGEEVVIGIRVGPGPFDPGPPADGISGLAVGVLTDLDAPVWYTIADGGVETLYLVSTSYPLEADFIGSFSFTHSTDLGYGSGVVVQCSDADGDVLYWPGRQGTPRPGDDRSAEETYSDRLSSCLGAARSIGLAPSSWVPALLGGVGCLLEWAFVPLPSVFDEAQTSIGDALGESTPTNYIAEAVPFVADTVTGLDDAIEGAHNECFVILPAVTDVVPEQEVCGADMPSDGGLRAFLVWVLYGGFAFKMLQLAGRIISGGDVIGPVTGYLGASDAETGTSSESEYGPVRVSSR